MPPKKSNLDLPVPKRNELSGSNVEQAATYIRRLIFAGILAPGAKVPQDQVASVLRMTRIPVREALHILELEGRVRIEPRRGAYVVAITEQAARDMAEVILLLYRFSAERAVQHSSQQVIEDLTRANQLVQETSDLVELHHAFDAFQAVIVNAGVDARLAAFIARLRSLNPDTIFEQNPDLAVLVKRTARSTLAAFKAGDVEKMDVAMRKWHLATLRKMVPLLQHEGLMRG